MLLGTVKYVIIDDLRAESISSGDEYLSDIRLEGILS